MNDPWINAKVGLIAFSAIAFLVLLTMLIAMYFQSCCSLIVPLEDLTSVSLENFEL